MARRRRKRNPTGWGDIVGGVAAVLIPTAVGLVAPEAVPVVAVTGGLVGAVAAYSNGFSHPSFARGYAVASVASMLGGIIVQAFSKPAAPPAALPPAAVAP